MHVIKYCEGSAPPVGVGMFGSMACAGNAIRGASPNRKNPVFGLGQDSKPAESQPCVRSLNGQPNDYHND